MYIPFNQIYHYLGSLIDPDAIIYRFEPSGSKNLKDLTLLRYPYKNGWLRSTDRTPIPFMVMHDQEPLNFDYYNQEYMLSNLGKWLENNHPPAAIQFNLSSEFRNYASSKNLGFLLATNYAWTLYDRAILVHSERKSPDVKKYRSIGLEPAYWWSHAMIARDWYRYAKLDPELCNLPNQYELDFNIYNRAWSGTREYRLKFAELVIDNNLAQSSNMRFNPYDNHCHYSQHQYVNENFKVAQDLETLPLNHNDSNSSADYSRTDYKTCWFDVVLETLFDDSRLHLTEKSLRPIACGKPFLLLGTPGSLAYLRDYGFKTFGNIIDESYDHETDPTIRMQKVITTMKQIQHWSSEQRNTAMQQIQQIVKHNKDWFWSDNFAKNIIKEFVDNVQNAWKTCQQHRNGETWSNALEIQMKKPELARALMNHAADLTALVNAELIRIKQNSCQ